GIFQCTQRGTQALFKRAKPKSIIDIATLTAIYRPGPLGAKVDKLYIENKKRPDMIEYGHPLIEEVLKETHGCIIFQEQVMKLCNQVAGIPKAECNAMRKMMKPVSSGNENINKAKKLQDKFIKGAMANGVSQSIAKSLYEKILFFAGYGFNKSHAVAYAINSYHCAWLMTYYEEEWIKAYLEAASGNPKKLAKAVSEVKGLGYKIVPIDINYAEKAWTSVGNKKLMPSFLSCKGIGSAAVDEILANRPYTSIENLLWNEDGSWKHSKFNKRALGSLIKIRGLSSVNVVGDNKTFTSYRQMLEIMEAGYGEFRKRTKKDPRRGITNFYEAHGEALETPEWSQKELMEFESDLLGSVNIEALLSKEMLKKLEQKSIKSIDEWEEKDYYWFMVTAANPKLTKNKKPYFLLNAIASTGKTSKIFCWGIPQGAEIQPYSFCVAEIDKNDFGCSTKWHRLKIVEL
ncbi:MAG TPA: hypothetical protein EYG21_07010, partial [Nitrospinaceae bacterium]|nr:hypothetical protein [Nitrospinaceae bacterium]